MVSSGESSKPKRISDRSSHSGIDGDAGQQDGPFGSPTEQLQERGRSAPEPEHTSLGLASLNHTASLEQVAVSERPVSATTSSANASAILDIAHASDVDVEQRAPGRSQLTYDQGVRTPQPAPEQAEANIPGVAPSPPEDFKYYSPPSENTVVPVSSPPDEEFFELEKDDVRRLLAELASARSGEPLRTEKQREAEAQRSQERWSKSTVRVQFPNRSILEKQFSSTEHIKAIYAFVRGCLREDMRLHKFVLFITPPYKELKNSDPDVKTKTLYELRLIPGGLLHFQFIEDHVKLSSRDTPPLLPEILASAATKPVPVGLSSERQGPAVQPTADAGKKPPLSKDDKLARLMKFAKRK